MDDGKTTESPPSLVSLDGEATAFGEAAVLTKDEATMFTALEDTTPTTDTVESPSRDAVASFGNVTSAETTLAA